MREQSYITGREPVHGKELEYVIPRPGRHLLELDEFWRDAAGGKHVDEVKGNLNYVDKQYGEFLTPQKNIEKAIRDMVEQATGQYRTIVSDASYRIILTRNPELVKPLRRALTRADLPHRWFMCRSRNRLAA